MTKDKVSLLNVCLTSFYMYSSLFTITTFNLLLYLGQESSIFSIIIGTIIGLLIIKVFLRINDYQNNLGIIDKLDNLFPKKINLLVKLVLVITIFFIFSFSIYNIYIFISNTLLTDINMIPIVILLLVPITYVTKQGIETLLRCSGVLIYFTILLIILAILGLIPYSSPNNLYPIVISTEAYLSPLYYTLITCFPIFMLLLIPKKSIYLKEKYNKYFKLTYIISCIYFLINFIIVISVLGSSYAEILKYPEINALKKVSLLNFIERLEVIVSFKVLIDSFISISCCFIYINELIKNVIKVKKDKLLIYLLDLLVLIFVIYIKPLQIKYLILFIGIYLLIHLIIYFVISKRTNH